MISNPAQSNALYNAGSPLARLITQVFAGSNGAVKVWAIPEIEGSAAATQANAITFTATTPAVGNVAIYINGVQYSAATTSVSTATTIAAAINTAIGADATCPVTSSPTAGVLALTAKVKGPYGNFITLSSSSQPGDQLPVGVTVAFVALAAGAVTSTVAADLTASIGSGNALPDGSQVTDIVHGWGQDSTSLIAFATYNGLGNVIGGMYDDLVGKPIRVFTGDVTTSLATLQTLTGNYLTDRANCIIAKPGSLTHPNELAAVVCGVCANVNRVRGEQNYIGIALPGVDPGYATILAGTDWTQAYYTGRDVAVGSGISPTVTVGSTVYLQNVVSFYRPASVPVTSNIYREFANISKLQNILASIRVTFSGPNWLGVTVVSDVKNVTVGVSRQFARDIEAVKDTLVALVKSWAANAWIYDPAFTIKAINNAVNQVVQTRVGGDGFTNLLPIILSGVMNIMDTIISADISLAVLSN